MTPILFDLNFQTCEPKLAYENYSKEIYSFENNNCSHTDLIELQTSDQGPVGPVETDTETQKF